MVNEVYYLMSPFFSRSSFVNHLIMLFCRNINFECILLIFKPFNNYYSHHLDLSQHKTIRVCVNYVTTYLFVYHFVIKIKRTNKEKGLQHISKTSNIIFCLKKLNIWYNYIIAIRQESQEVESTIDLNHEDEHG